MLLPEVKTVLGALVRPVITIDATHGVSGSHLCTRYLSIGSFETLKYSRVIDIVLCHVIEEVAHVTEGKFVGTLVLDIIDVL